MILEYERPVAEIIDFRALEHLASAQDEKSARDGGYGGVNPSIGDGVVDEW